MKGEVGNERTFTRAELAQVARNGWAVADVPDATRRAMIGQIDGLAEAPVLPPDDRRR